MSNPVQAREQSRAAAAEARQLQAEAEQAQADAAARKRAAEDAARVAAEQGRAWDLAEQGWRLNAGNELRQLRKQVDAVLAEKPDPTRPTPETRILARRLLRDVDPDPFKILQRLGALDETWGRFNALEEASQMFISRSAELADEGLNAGADELECQCHRAALARLRWLAGEAD
jgi:hypothetical protein